MRKYQRHNVPSYMMEDVTYWWDYDDYDDDYGYNYYEEYDLYEYVKEDKEEESVLINRRRYYRSPFNSRYVSPFNNNGLKIDMNSIYPPSVLREKKIDMILNRESCQDFSNTIENIIPIDINPL